MQMQQCGKGHFYDQDRYRECPYCTGESQFEERAIPLTRTTKLPAEPFPQTVPVDRGAIPPTAPVDAAPLPETVPLAQDGCADAAGQGLVLGWLVCIEGSKRGRDFRINTERCFVGRTPSNDICLDWETRLSRESHLVIYYNREKNEFWLDVTQSQENICVNGELVFSQVRLQDRDILAVGDTKLTFCAFCRGPFSWRNDR